jgi:hypothetical protein
METAAALTCPQKCATASKIDYATLSTCFNGAESEALQKKAAAMTPSDHKYTPWVVLNGTIVLDLT